MSSKKKSSSKGDSKKSSSKDKVKSSAATEKPTNSAPAPEGSSDFEAGILFNKYDPDRTGNLTAAAFRQMWKEARAGMKEAENVTANGDGAGISTFDAGGLFAKFDNDRDGKLDKHEFEAMVRSHPELLSGPRTSPSAYMNLPQEVITGRLLTHYDETAGVAIPRSAIPSHEAMGNSVHPLVEAYTLRYGRLRTMLTSKLLPRRENFLQLRRQLLNASADVEAARMAIEKETVADADRIIERLRAVESARQSAIHHQMLHLEEELNNIERIVRRVEVANEKGQHYASSGIVITPASDTYTGHSRAVTYGSSAGPGGNQQAVSYGFAEAVTTPRADLMVELIQQYTDLIATIDRASSKQVNVQVDFPTDDFPKEVSDRLEVIAKCDRYSHALAVKDHMLWLALKDKEDGQEKLEQEKALCQEYAAEISHWAEAAQSMKERLFEAEREIERTRRENDELKRMLGQHHVYFE